MKSNGFPYLTDFTDGGCAHWPACGCPSDDLCDADERVARPLMVVVLNLAAWAVLLLALAAIAMGVIGIVRAHAHEAATGWDYPLSCCFGTASGGDCQAISSKTVTPIDGGYRITLRPGDHNQVTKLHVFDVPASKVRISEDTSYHICLWPTEDKVQCFFAPPMSY